MSSFIEISKQKARMRFYEGKTIRLMASKINPNSYWGEPLPANNKEHKWQNFEQLCNAFAFYNCTKETGRKIKFYIKDGD